MKRTEILSLLGIGAEPWAAAVPFPVVGEAHPLRRRYREMVMRAALAAALAHVAIFSIFFAMENRRSVEPTAIRIRIVKTTDFPPPPSLRPDVKPPDWREILQKAAPAIAVANPVDDFRAVERTIATQMEMSAGMPEPDLRDLLRGERDSIVVVAPASDPSGNPLPDTFVAYEEAPVLIQLPPPIYPEMARQAEVEGTVVVRVLIGKDGKVADAKVTEGIPMLNDAALRSARQARFKPALQQHKPVAVWVQIPMAFNLH